MTLTNKVAIKNSAKIKFVLLLTVMNLSLVFFVSININGKSIYFREQIKDIG